jgi:hypothetical protein
MSIAHQIQIAADLLELELNKQGIFSISKAECMHIARVLYSAWTLTRDTSNMAPGEIAQNHRARYEARAEIHDDYLIGCNEPL